MRDADDMTIEEALEELRPLLLDYLPTGKDDDYKQRLEDLYYRLDANFNDSTLHNFTAEVEYLDNEKSYKLTTNLISGDYFDALNTYGYDDFLYALQEGEYISTVQPEIDEKCASFSLEKLQQELTDEVLQKVFKGHNIVSFKYLLANPRKEVVEWALKHKDELGLTFANSFEFVGEFQSVRKLRKLILQRL